MPMSAEEVDRGFSHEGSPFVLALWGAIRYFARQGVAKRSRGPKWL